MNYYPGFKYVDVGDAKSKWERILRSEIEKFRSKFNNIDFCQSVARYDNQEHQDSESMLMGISIDLDGENLEFVLSEARLLREYFYSEWDLKKEEVRFYYSGNRSVHIEIQPETLSISPHKCLYLYLRELVRAVADSLELNCVDFSLYAQRHLFRYVGTLHSKTGKFKIELDPSELNLSSGEIKKLADTNRGSLYVEEDLNLSKNGTASKCFNEIFEIAKQSIDESDFRGSKIESLSLIKGLSKSPACVQDLLDHNIRVKGTRNRATLVLVTFLKDVGKTMAETLELLVPWTKAIPAGLTDANEQKRLAHLESLANYIFSAAGKEYHFACPFILSLGSEDSPIKCKSRCQLRIAKETRKSISISTTAQNIIGVAYIPKVGEFLAELIYDPVSKTPAFALYNPKTDKVEYVDEISSEYPNVYVPYIDENVIKGSVLFPSRAEEYGSEESLYEEVNAFIAKYYNEPNKTHRTFNTCYVFFTWVYDRFRSWCYLHYLGSAGGGKTRAEDAIGYLCYRPIRLGGADSAPCMFRMLDRYRGTAIIDEATFMDKSEAHAAIVQILNVGYKRDGSVGRCEGDDNRQVRYMVGSPKLLATRVEFHDDGLRSRCFVRRTGRDGRIKEGEHRQPFVLPDGFEEEALSIRNKLLLWRLRHWEGAKLDSALEIKGVESRINEIIVPILSVMHSDTVRNDIETLAREQQEDLKQQRQSSLEGEILRVIKDKGFDSGDIHPSEIKDKINEEKKNEKPISTHTITAILKKLELQLHKYGNRYLLSNSLINKELLQELFRDYDLTEEVAES